MEDNQLIIYVVTGVAVTVFITLFVLYLSVRERKRYLTQQGRLEKMEAEKQQEVLRAVIQTVEQERMRIARDLHDSVGSSLSMIKLELSTRAHLHGSGAGADNYSDTLEKLDKVVGAIRSTCFQLYPSSLSVYGLNAMLEQTVEKWRESAALQTRYSNEVPEARYGDSPDFKLNLFRVFEEAVNNVVKHGRCSTLKVHVSGSGESACVITISHNGLPFTHEQAQAQRNKGIGLSSIASRLNLIGGSIHYFSNENDRVVQIKAPLANG